MPQRSIGTKYYFLKDMSTVIRFLIISDTITVGAAGLLAPIFALFVEGFIKGGNAAVAGIAAGIYLFSKSIFQIPAAAIIDKIRGEKDDFYILFIFTIICSLIPLTYLIIDTPIELYIIQFLTGLLTAFTYPSFMAIFTRHISNEKEGTAWGVYFTLTDLSSAAMAGIGGYIATVQGFTVVIIGLVGISLIGTALLIPIKPYLKIYQEPPQTKIEK